MLRSPKRVTRRLSLQSAQRDPRNNQLTSSLECERKWTRVQLTNAPLGFIEMSEQQEAAGFEITGMRGVDFIAVRLENRPRLIQGFRRPAEIARDECDLGLGDDTSRTGNSLFRTEGASGTAYERSRSHEIAQLGHRNAPKRQCRRVVAQRHPIQCTEWITHRQRARRRCDYRVHLTSDTPDRRLYVARL